MASQNLNVGTSANSNDGDTLRAAFINLKKMFAEVYGQTYSEQGDLSGTDFKIRANQLQMTANPVAGDDGKVLTYDHVSGSFTWEDAFTGTIGDITGIVAGLGLTGSSLDENEATLNVGAGTGITVANDSVSLATTVQDEITLNTAKTGFPGFGTAAGTSLEGDTALLQVGTLATEALAGNTTTITPAQAAEIADNTLKVSDQTVTLTEGANVTITGTYPSFTIASDDVVGAVTSVNGDVGVVVLDTDDVSQGTTNLYNVTHTGDVSDSSGVLTIADNVVNATKLDVTGNGSPGQLLQSDGDGSMTWVTGVTGDITSIIATDGLTTPDGTAGDVTIGLAAGVAGDGLTLTSGVLDVSVATSQIADNAVTSPKLAEFDDTFNAGTSGDIIVSNGTDFIHETMSGDATIVSGGAITIADDAVTYAKMQNVSATNIILGRDSAGAGIVEEITPASLRTMINVEDGANAYSHPDHSGEVTSTADGATVIADGAVVADRLATDAVTTDKILDNAVDYDKLADEFTISAAISVSDVVDFSSAAVFTKTLSGTTTLTFSGVETGMVKTLVISGNHSFALPSGVTYLNGTYSGTATKNIIQIVSTNGSSEMFATVSNV